MPVTSPHLQTAQTASPSPDAPLFTVVVPAYNEEAAIAGVLNSFAVLPPEYEILVVDDGSTDRTADIVRSSKVRCISRSVRGGYGAALKLGIRHARTPFVITADADGQHCVQGILRVADELLHHGFDMVIGVRTADSSRPLARRPGKAILQWAARVLVGGTVPDLNSGLRGFRREVVGKYLHLMPNGFSFSTTCTFAFIKSGCHIGYVPIVAHPRVGRSTVKIVRDGTRVLTLLLRLAILFAPLKIFGTAGALLMLFGLLYTTYTVIAGLGITDLSVLTAIGGMLVVFFGLLADQVCALRREFHE